MKRKSLSYRLLVTVCSLANVLIAGELIMVLRQPGELTLFPLVYLLSVDIAFFILVVVLLAARGACFNRISTSTRPGRIETRPRS
jgi:hypothetical protein